VHLADAVGGFGVYGDAGAGRVYWSPEIKALPGLPPNFPAWSA